MNLIRPYKAKPSKPGAPNKLVTAASFHTKYQSRVSLGKPVKNLL